jgi:Spy/CpxP family protein refolding chaperone
MKASTVAIITLLGAVLAAPAFAQRGMGQGHGPGANVSVSELSLAQHQQLREERQQRRDARSQMSGEDRRQLRQDIRDAGQAIYPLERNGGRMQRFP